MTQMKSGSVFLTAILLAVIAAFSVNAAAAEKKEQTYVKSNFRTVYKTSVTVNDAPSHEVTQEGGVADIKYSNNDFKIKDEWVYVQSDLIDGAGTQIGYYIDTHLDGSHSYGYFKGTIKNTSKPDGSWESVWEGTYEYRGGSGKFKNLKGSGKYKGKASSQDPAGREEGHETIEY
jgi:hypothetical protein